ncbi:MAG: 3-oxoacid CoA-transferase subunit A [Spirochaetaceae bacterium]|nr:3-oxoacid CoA-transferase subunit A [Spirochaetaceae bacterium]
MTNKPIVSAAEAAAMVKEGMVVQSGGFMGCGAAETVIAELAKLGTKGLTLVTTDTAVYDAKTGKGNGCVPLIVNGQCSRIIASHIGANAETQRQMNSGQTKVDLVPQGTLAERIRSAGAGLGGFLTPTGLGTEVEEGKQKILVGHRVFLLEEPLPGDIALIKAKKADKAGNLQYSKVARNFNPLMASACAVVVAEVEEIVEIGELDPDQVHTPSIFVNFLVQARG